MSNKKRVLVVLYAGDYYEAYQRMKSGLGEAYHCHNYALRSLSQFSQMDEVEAVAVLGCATTEAYDHVLDIGFRVIGGATVPHEEPEKIKKIISGYAPTHIVLRTPSSEILKWSIQNQVKTITLFADSFKITGIKTYIKSLFLSRFLNNSLVEWVGNHHIQGSLSLKAIGVNPAKIIPWDWPHTGKEPANFSVKQIDTDRDRFQAVYVGSIQPSKGVDNIIDAIKLLQDDGKNVGLKIAGRPKNIGAYKQKIEDLELQDVVEFLGLIPNENVIHLMRDADFVFVPSHHNYPEGFPRTIFEALCCKTPLIASDHPMFINNLKHGHDAMIFPEQQPDKIADCVSTLLDNPILYSNISKNAEDTWHKLQVSTKWADFIAKWIEDTPENRQWLTDRTLTARYAQHL